MEHIIGNAVKRKQKRPSANPKKSKTVNETTCDISSKESENEMLPTVNLLDKYPVLKDQELVKKFMSVPMNNNQKGRIRQTVKEFVTGAPENSLPDVINDKIKEIIKKNSMLTDSELRKIRILFNMLKTVIEKQKSSDKHISMEKKPKKEKTKSEGDVERDVVEKENGEENSNVAKKNNNNKIKGPKRYVVFVGNLPVDIKKEQIMEQFSDISDHIKDVRIPVRAEGNKSCIAYVELNSEAAYELALSKHHSMLCNKRINVLYTAQKNGKVSIAEAKGKAAKLVALQKAGKLLGSVPLNKKRSHRRAIQRAARAREAKENNK